MARIDVIGLDGLPDVAAGDDLASLIAEALVRQHLELADGDVLVVTQKVVSKAEGASVDLATVEPSAFAAAWAAEHDRDARQVEVVLRESRRLVRMSRGIIIAETRHGHICANAGVDTSNAADGVALTLPVDPDASAARIRHGVQQRTGIAVGVIVSDTFGRPWREGQVNVAIGLAGVRALDDYRGCLDTSGRALHASVLAVADEIASAAELVMGKTRRCPVALVRGLDVSGTDGARSLLRDPAHDLFR